jgi:hypothetical protein
MSTRRNTLGILAACVAVTAGCGGDSTSAPQAASTQRPPSKTILGFEPDPQPGIESLTSCDELRRVVGRAANYKEPEIAAAHTRTARERMRKLGCAP